MSDTLSVLYIIVVLFAPAVIVAINDAERFTCHFSAPEKNVEVSTFVWVDFLRPSQHVFSHVRAGLPRFNQYSAKEKRDVLVGG